MSDWATEFAHEILKTEAKTHETWSGLSIQLKAAVAEINAILDGKSQTKLTLAETGDVLLLTSNRKASLNLDSHARTMSVVIDQSNYNFNFTEDPQKVTSASTPFLQGITSNAPIDISLIVGSVTRAVVDLRK